MSVVNIVVNIIEQACVVSYFMALSGLALYGLHRIWLLVCWLTCWQRPNGQFCAGRLPLTFSAKVTVQLPLFNERFVAARVIDAVAQLAWPTDRLEIQVLDDSTDETVQIVDERVEHWVREGVPIHTIRRIGRSGFKAGALAMGTAVALGEFIAIFDADFVPPLDFLEKTIPHFSNPAVGMVQARWGFLNGGQSWFTALQALFLGAHFSIEHKVRFSKGWFFNFNGTAGVFRKEAIVSAGGWHPDTVTEDLDLSYRAQLAGWRFVYVDDLRVPSELPITISAFRSQQQRWAQGSIQTARKLLPRLLRTPGLPPGIKFEAAAHLLANLGWVLGAALSCTIYPAIVWRAQRGPLELLLLDAPLFLGATGATLLYFAVYVHRRLGGGRSLFLLPLLPFVAIGFAPSVAIGVIKGMVSKGGIFHRTPKFGVGGLQPKDSSLEPGYGQSGLCYIVMHVALFGYSIFPLVFAWKWSIWSAIPFVFLFPVGFLIMVCTESCDLARTRGR